MFGAYNQQSALPGWALAGEPGVAAALLRHAVALEVGFALVVIAMTWALVVTEPASSG